MKLYTSAIMVLFTGVCTAQNGIWVGQPKVYDDYYLQSQLNAQKANLANLNGLNATALSNGLGTIQGATLSGSGLAVQGLGPGTTQTTTLTAPSSVPATVTATGAYGTTTTGPTNTPSIPTAPAPTLTLPSTPSPSAVDTLNQEMQLSYQIINYQLLLDGALNDRMTPGSQNPKQRVTVGFSINIDPPEALKKDLKNALAEVEVTVDNSAEAGAVAAPSIVTLLPREKTYNVVGMVQHSLSIGAGAILAGVVSLGASWGWWKQKAYIYEQQDTLALEESADDGRARFVWQFRPVLDHDYVTSGTRQTFVQFSLPKLTPDKQTAAVAIVHINTHWRKLDPKTGLVEATLIAPAAAPYNYPIPYFNLFPIPKSVDVTDLGGGMVAVKAQGNFLPGVRVRIGPVTLDPNSPNFQASDSMIRFIAPAQDLVTGGAYLINRDGSERMLADNLQLPGGGPAEPVAAPARVVMPAGNPASNPNTCLAGSTSSFQIKPEITPFSDSRAHLKIAMQGTPNDTGDPSGGIPGNNPLVVTIGGQVFGLRNAPFLRASPTVLELIVPTDLLKTNNEIVVQRLLGDPATRASACIPLDSFPKTGFSVSGATLIANSDPLYVLVNGSGLDNAKLLDKALAPPPKPDKPCTPGNGKRKPADCPDPPPACLSVVDNTHATFLVLALQKNCLDQTKEFLIAKEDNLPAVVTMPDVKVEPAKPVDPLTGKVAPGAQKVDLTGKGLDQVKQIRFGKTLLPFTLSLDKKTLTVILTVDITNVEAVRGLDIEMADGSKLRFLLTVKKP